MRFEPEAGGPGMVRFAELVEWNRHDDPRVRYYSGIAEYHASFDSPLAKPESERTLELDLGTVPGMARVRLNGHDLGVLWCAPWRVDLTGALRDGANELVIEVANLWPNRLIGDSGLSVEERVSWTTWSPFQPDSPLLPSGLLGPVRLLELVRGSLSD